MLVRNVTLDGFSRILAKSTPGAIASTLREIARRAGEAPSRPRLDRERRRERGRRMGVAGRAGEGDPSRRNSLVSLKSET